MSATQRDPELAENHLFDEAASFQVLVGVEQRLVERRAGCLAEPIAGIEWQQFDLGAFRQVCRLVHDRPAEAFTRALSVTRGTLPALIAAPTIAVAVTVAQGRTDSRNSTCIRLSSSVLSEAIPTGRGMNQRPMMWTRTSTRPSDDAPASRNKQPRCAAGARRRPNLRDLSTAGGLNDDPHLHTETGEHVDEGLDAEQMQAPTQEIAHARLAHLQQLRKLRLLESARGDDLLDLNQEIRSDYQVLGLLLGEPEIPETLPLDAVILSLLFVGIGASPVHEGAEAILREM